MDTERKQLLETILVNIGELHRRFATSRDVFLAQFELSRPQMELLFAIKTERRSTGEIAKIFSITSSAVSQMVDQLERKGLVERVRDTKDKRVIYVQLAEKTREVFQGMRAKYIDHLNTRFTDITDAELKVLLKILTKTVETGKDGTWRK